MRQSPLFTPLIPLVLFKPQSEAIPSVYASLTSAIPTDTTAIAPSISSLESAAISDFAVVTSALGSVATSLATTAASDFGIGASAVDSIATAATSDYGIVTSAVGSVATSLATAAGGGMSKVESVVAGQTSQSGARATTLTSGAAEEDGKKGVGKVMLFVAVLGGVLLF